MNKTFLAFRDELHKTPANGDNETRDQTFPPNASAESQGKRQQSVNMFINVHVGPSSGTTARKGLPRKSVAKDKFPFLWMHEKSSCKHGYVQRLPFSPTM